MLRISGCKQKATAFCGNTLIWKLPSEKVERSQAKVLPSARNKGYGADTRLWKVSSCGLGIKGAIWSLEMEEMVFAHSVTGPGY